MRMFLTSSTAGVRLIVEYNTGPPLSLNASNHPGLDDIITSMINEFVINVIIIIIITK